MLAAPLLLLAITAPTQITLHVNYGDKVPIVTLQNSRGELIEFRVKGERDFRRQAETERTGDLVIEEIRHNLRIIAFGETNAEGRVKVNPEPSNLELTTKSVVPIDKTSSSTPLPTASSFELETVYGGFGDCCEPCEPCFGFGGYFEPAFYYYSF